MWANHGTNCGLQPWSSTFAVGDHAVLGGPGVWCGHGVGVATTGGQNTCLAADSGGMVAVSHTNSTVLRRDISSSSRKATTGTRAATKTTTRAAIAVTRRAAPTMATTATTTT